MKELKATVTVSLAMREEETEEQASDRLYDLMYEGLCQTADHHCEFWIESVREAE